ncbi:MAG: isoprenylcysteine carboxylmethyltransferase family protein [Candidatus Cloacimonadales bacterium]|nr:isoprenylcysteine carboxylmethyltransferase family protein [Candidatus Cloacimonadales bacterium]
MKLIGKTPINPVLFFSGKIAGYTTWIIFILTVLQVLDFNAHSIIILKFASYSLFLIGLIFTIISLINLGNSTSLGLPSESTTFKTNGLYKISRNPMYLGFNCFTLAAIFLTLNVTVIIMGIYSLVVYHFIILAEEEFLEQRFQKDYLKYKNKIRRYF